VRQVLLVIILMVAAFVGGSFVSGPALQWVQNRVFRSLGWNEGDITSIDLKIAAGLDQPANTPAAPKSDPDLSDEPSAPVPSLVTEHVESPARQPAKQSSPSLRPAKLIALSESSPQAALGSSQAPSQPNSAPQPLAALDPNIKPANVPSQAAVPSALPSKTGPPPAILDALSDLVPLNRPADASSPPSPSVPKTDGVRHDDWEIIVHKMQTLGVSRFSVEGEAGGRVVFSCLIPLAGKQAVTQRFEAEAGDPVTAAQAAFRRIALWRGAQVGGHQGVPASE
jgi:hypothetical protein